MTSKLIIFGLSNNMYFQCYLNDSILEGEKYFHAKKKKAWKGRQENSGNEEEGRTRLGNNENTFIKFYYLMLY